MASFPVLLKKEIKQQIKTYRLLIIVAIFIVVGIYAPLSLGYFSNFMQEEAGNKASEYTTVDVVQGYIQFFLSVGMIAAILLAMGAIAKERALGTAAMVLSKPASSGAFVGAKLAALSLTLGTGIAIGALSCYICTAILFEGINAPDFFLINLLIWLFLEVCLAITVMWSSFFQSQLAAAGIALITLFVLAGITQLAKIKDYTPGAFQTWADSIATGNADNSWGAIPVTFVFVILFGIIGWRFLKSKEL